MNVDKDQESANLVVETENVDAVEAVAVDESPLIEDNVDIPQESLPLPETTSPTENVEATIDVEETLHHPSSFGNIYTNQVFASKISNDDRVIEIGSLQGKVSVLGDLVVCGTLSCVDMTTKPKHFDNLHVKEELVVDKYVETKSVKSDFVRAENVLVQDTILLGPQDIVGGYSKDSWRIRTKNGRLFFERFNGSEWQVKSQLE